MCNSNVCKLTWSHVGDLDPPVGGVDAQAEAKGRLASRLESLLGQVRRDALRLRLRLLRQRRRILLRRVLSLRPRLRFEQRVPDGVLRLRGRLAGHLSELLLLLLL